MPAVKFFARLDLDLICLFLDGHWLTSNPEKLSMQCPKCGYDQTDGSSECPRCGIVFAKWHQQQAVPPPDRSTPRATVDDEEAETGLIRFDHTIARLSHGVCALLITMAVALGTFLIVKQYGILRSSQG